MTVLGTVLVGVGVAFLAISAVGLLRLPDVYTRAHAVAKSETLGLLLIFVGMLFLPELTWGTAVRLGFVLLFSLLANPVAVHALAREARRGGVAAWRQEEGAT